MASRRGSKRVVHAIRIADVDAARRDARQRPALQAHGVAHQPLQAVRHRIVRRGGREPASFDHRTASRRDRSAWRGSRRCASICASLSTSLRRTAASRVDRPGPASGRSRPRRADPRARARAGRRYSRFALIVKRCPSPPSTTSRVRGSARNEAERLGPELTAVSLGSTRWQASQPTVSNSLLAERDEVDAASFSLVSPPAALGNVSCSKSAASWRAFRTANGPCAHDDERGPAQVFALPAATGAGPSEDDVARVPARLCALRARTRCPAW